MMLWILIGVGAVLVLLWLVVGLLYHFGLISFYHPMKKAKDSQIKVACVGDSITYGCMVENWRKNNYPAILSGLLGEKYCVNNFGYTNRTAIKSGDFPLVKEKVYKQSIDFKPNIVVLLLGSNDSKENNWSKEKFVNDYSEMIDSYLEQENLQKLYLLVPPPVFEVKGKILYKLRKSVIENEICPAVKQIAKTKGVELIDLHKLFENKKDLFADGVHPNAKGCSLLAQKIYEVLKK